MWLYKRRNNLVFENYSLRFQINVQCTLYMTVIFVTLLLSGCGGGGSSEESSTDTTDGINSTTLLNADNYSDYLTKLYPYIGDSELMNELVTYNAKPSDFPSVYNLFTQNNVIQGTYQVTPAPGQGLDNEWPSITADLKMSATSLNTSLQEWMYDYTTNVHSELGNTQVFFGVKNIEYDARSNVRVPLVVIIEEIAKHQDVPLYRALRIFR